MSVSPARRVAFEVLRAVSTSDAFANLALPAALQRADLSPADAGLATELTYGTLRLRGFYDAVIERAAGRPVSKIDGAVLDALRLGAHQLLSTRVAPHAAVHESVELVRGASRGARGPVGFANAVLRAISKRDLAGWRAELSQGARDEATRLSLVYAHPVWIVRALGRALAAEGREAELETLLAADNGAPGVTMTALPGVAEVPGDATPTPASPIGFRLAGGDPEVLIRRSHGGMRVQDEGSQLAALALSRARPIAAGERWLDLCAGPGGKTAVLAAEAKAGGARLEANEPVPARAGLVRRSIAGVDLDVPVSEQDGRTRAGEGRYDRILVDAPCTGLGALRRRPEARWRKQPSDVAELRALQTELFEAAADALAPGGILAYVTCSPHLAETSGVVADATRDRDDLVALDAHTVLQGIARTPLDLAGEGPAAQLWPHRGGTDAMFIALFQRA